MEIITRSKRHCDALVKITSTDFNDRLLNCSSGWSRRRTWNTSRSLCVVLSIFFFFSFCCSFSLLLLPLLFFVFFFLFFGFLFFPSSFGPINDGEFIITLSWWTEEMAVRNYVAVGPWAMKVASDWNRQLPSGGSSRLKRKPFSGHARLRPPPTSWIVLLHSIAYKRLLLV